jgi:branched-chain amino acid transport system ATP-binding protein
VSLEPQPRGRVVHDSIAEQYARPILPIVDRAYVMGNGSLTLSGTGKELMDNPEVKAAYFGV